MAKGSFFIADKWLSLCPLVVVLMDRNTWSLKFWSRAKTSLELDTVCLCCKCYDQPSVLRKWEVLDVGITTKWPSEQYGSYSSYPMKKQGRRKGASIKIGFFMLRIMITMGCCKLRGRWGPLSTIVLVHPMNL